MLVERRPGVVLGQDAFQPGIVALDGDHRIIHHLADGRLLGLALEMRPPGLLRHPEDVLGPVFVGVFGIGPLVLGRQKPLVHLLERVGDVLQEDQPQDDVLVFRRVHVVAELVGGEPQLGLESEVGPVAVALAAGGDLLLAHFARFRFQRRLLRVAFASPPILPRRRAYARSALSGKTLFYRIGGLHTSNPCLTPLHVRLFGSARAWSQLERSPRCWKKADDYRCSTVRRRAPTPRPCESKPFCTLRAWCSGQRRRR